MTPVAEKTLNRTRVSRAVNTQQDEPIKWSASMLEAFEDSKRGDWKVMNMDNFWDE